MCWSLTSGLSPATRLAARVGVLVWSLWLCRAIKYVDHCRRYRHDIRYLVALPLIAYVHAIGVKLWAMLTLHEVSFLVKFVRGGLRREHQDTDFAVSLLP